MAISETRVRPPEFIEAAGKTFLGDLSTAVGDYKGADLSKVYGAQNVAGLDPLQNQAIKELQSGLGSFQPYIQAAGAATGPQGYEQFMSPYQQDVINATLGEYDIQSQKGLGNISQNAIASGAFGGSREGVAQAEYMSGSDRNRAALQAQRQNELSANQQLNIQNLNQPLTAANQYGSGVTQLIAGYPGKTTQDISPNPSGLQSLISAGSGLAGIYRTLQG
tara:strand:- start:38 stop:700 length:663 start_codon:yes stop_codon:yes gene_type:complete